MFLLSCSWVAIFVLDCWILKVSGDVVAFKSSLKFPWMVGDIKLFYVNYV